MGCAVAAGKFGRLSMEGAVVFMMGCGDRLAAQLGEIGVSVLDCSGNDTVSLQRVRAHQRTWCANKDGHILP